MIGTEVFSDASTVDREAMEVSARVMKRDGMTYAQIGVALGVCEGRALLLVRAPAATYDAVKARNGGRCEGCGSMPIKGAVHHSEKYLELDLNHPDNLVFLCVSCHGRQHKKSPEQRARASKRGSSVKERILNIRLSQPEKDAIIRAADRDGLGMSAWLRQVALRGAGALPKAAKS